MNKSLLAVCIMAIVLTSPIIVLGQYDSIQHDDNYRTYLVHLPPEYSPGSPLPLILAMHGGFGSAFNLQEQSKLSEKADEENFIVVYPEGIKGGALNIRTWNAGWCCGYASNSNIDDVGFINALMDTLIDRYSIDTDRIYATGMSNGGFLSYRLACELSDRIAAIAPVACSMSMTSCNPARGVPVIHFHSYDDESIPDEGGIGNGVSGHYNPPLDSVLNAWADHNGCMVKNDTVVHTNEFTFAKWKTCECGAEVNVYISQDGGHSWPGGTQTQIGDPVSQFISATDLMWSFFQQYSLECKTTVTSARESKPSGYIELFPNPTSGKFTIRNTEKLAGFTVTVYNPLGQAVWRSANTYAIDLSDQQAGVYQVLIETQKEKVTRKLIKVH